MQPVSTREAWVSRRSGPLSLDQDGSLSRDRSPRPSFICLLLDRG